MNTFLINKYKTVLTRAGVNLLFTLLIVTVDLCSIPQQSFAAPFNNGDVTTVANSFSAFCHFYYYNVKNAANTQQNTQNCRREKNAFGTLLVNLAGDNASMWPATDSLKDLADQNLLGDVQTQRDFLNATASNLYNLLNPRRDRSLLSTLWQYNSTDVTVHNNVPDFNTNPSCNNTFIGLLGSINVCTVANNFCEANSTSCPSKGDTTDCNSDTSGDCQVYIVTPSIWPEPFQRIINCPRGNYWQTTQGSSNQYYMAQVSGSTSRTCHQAFWFSPASDGSTCQISMWIPGNADAQINFTIYSMSTPDSPLIRTPVDESDPNVQGSWASITPDNGVSMDHIAWGNFVYLSDAIGNNSLIAISVAKFVCTSPSNM